MKQVIVVLVLLSVVCAINAATVAFAGNVSASIDKDGDWAYRKTDLSSWDLGVLGAGVYFSSVSASGTPANASGDAVWGAARVFATGYPIVYLAYWSAALSFGAGTDWGNLDVSEASGFIAHSYVELVEKDPTGKVVANAALKQEILPGSLQYDLSDPTTNGHLKYSSLTGSSSAPWTFELTFVVTDVTGVLEGGAVVVPKSLETIVTVSNWPYKSTQNSLSLVMGVATGSSSYDGSVLVSGSGFNKVYFQVANEAVVDGSKKGVTVSAFTKSDLTTNFDDSSIETQLQGKYSGNVDVNLVTVTFPAGAANIEYDPSIGAGATPPNSSASTVVGSLFLLGLIMLLHF